MTVREIDLGITGQKEENHVFCLTSGCRHNITKQLNKIRESQYPNLEANNLANNLPEVNGNGHGNAMRARISAHKHDKVHNRRGTVIFIHGGTSLPGMLTLLALEDPTISSKPRPKRRLR